MMGQRTGNYKGSEFQYLGGCWSHPLRGHVYGPGLATPKQFSKETEMEFPAGANSPLPVELGRPPPGLLTFQRALRDTSVTHLPHCAELQSDTRPPPALLGTTVGVSPNLPALQQPAWSPFTVKARTCLASHLEGKSLRSQECQPPVSGCPGLSVLCRPVVPLQERGGLSESPVGCLTPGRGGCCRVTSLTRPESPDGRLPDGPGLYSPTGLGPERGSQHPLSHGAGPLLLHQRTWQVTETSSLLGAGGSVLNARWAWVRLSRGPQCLSAPF